MTILTKFHIFLCNIKLKCCCIEINYNFIVFKITSLIYYNKELDCMPSEMLIYALKKQCKIIINLFLLLLIDKIIMFQCF